MIRFKYFLFRTQGFEAFQSPEFLASDNIFIVAQDPKLQTHIQFVRKHVPVNLRTNKEHIEKLTLEAIEQLDRKIQSQGTAYTLLSKDPTFSQIKHNKLKTIILPVTAKETSDYTQAQSIAIKISQQLRQIDLLEHPELNFSDSNPNSLLKFLENKVALDHINLEHKEIAPLWNEITRKKKMLVHICCGPDAAGVIEQLKDDYELICFWYDPNIQPKEEYDLRLEAFEKVANKENIPYVVGEYDVDRFLEKIKGLEYSPEQGAKCSKCYDMRLERAAAEAQKHNCDFFTSSLAISPHKVQQKLKVFGELHGETFKVKYYARNFMKDQGFKSSVEYSKIYDIYRQDYCGCWFSLHEGGAKAKQMAKDLGYLPPAPDTLNI